MKVQTNCTISIYQWGSTVTIHPLKMGGSIQDLGLAKRRGTQLNQRKSELMIFLINQRKCILKLYWKFWAKLLQRKSTQFFSSYPLSALRFENHVHKSVIAQLYRAVGDDSKFKLSHSTEKTAQLLEMLKSLPHSNKSMGSIQYTITDSKRDKQIDHPKTTLTLNSDKQKQNLKKHGK